MFYINATFRVAPKFFDILFFFKIVFPLSLPLSFDSLYLDYFKLRKFSSGVPSTSKPIKKFF